jgi:hypothetical protein
MDAMTETETAMETPSEPVVGRDRPSRAETSRRNGRASKGPRSTTGKARSAMNATRHGLTAEAAVLALVGETAADWAAHRAGIIDALAPAGALEAELAERVASLTWRLRRVVRAETATLAGQLEDAERRAVRDARPLPPRVTALDLELDEEPPTLEELRDDAARLAPRRDAHQRVARARLGDDDPDAPLDPGDVLVFAQDLTRRARVDLDALDRALPDWRARRWTGRTVGEMARALRPHPDPHLEDADALLVNASLAAMLDAECEAERVADAERRLERLRAERVVPRSSDRAELLERYEAHLQRQLSMTLATLRGVRETFSSTGWTG